MSVEGIGNGSRGPGVVDLAERGGGKTFAGELTKFLKDVNSDQVKAAGEIKRLAVDGEGSIHEAMVAMSNAEGSFRLAMEIRNRVIQGINQLLQTTR